MAALRPGPPRREITIYDCRTRPVPVICGDRRSATAGMITHVSLRLLYLIVGQLPAG